MPKNWSTLAEQSSGLYEESDFKQALYQLICSQVLYAKDMSQSVSYAIIHSHKNEFREAADLSGQRLDFNDTYRFCYVIPYVGKQQVMDLTETLLLLVLRKLYHDKASTGDLEVGEAIVSIPDLMSAFTAATNRELPTNTGQLRDIIQQMRRYGIAKLGPQVESDPQPFTIIILPAIVEIISESAISRLGAYQNAIVETVEIEGDQEVLPQGEIHEKA